MASEEVNARKEDRKTAFRIIEIMDGIRIKNIGEVHKIWFFRFIFITLVLGGLLLQKGAQVDQGRVDCGEINDSLKKVQLSTATRKNICDKLSANNCLHRYNFCKNPEETPSQQIKVEEE